jgi:hypothetical protein
MFLVVVVESIGNILEGMLYHRIETYAIALLEFLTATSTTTTTT